MKLFKILILWLLMMAGIAFQAQTEPCYFDPYQRSHKQQIDLMEAKIQTMIQNPPQKIHSHDTNLRVIPVVVHVIHDGGTNNISDAQVLSQITVLNEDFRKLLGTNGYGNGVDTEIEFCLAKKDPQGKCTNGIVRIKSPLANHQTYQRSMLKQLSFWDNTRYLNIYVVKNINNGSGTAGYASFPGGPADEDGIVIRHDYFGKVGTAAATLGRTATHEIGHWLGLYHTFNGGCGVDPCIDGDYVCDTPPAANPNFGCPTVNSCSNDVPNVNDQIQNYMDYSNDNCKNLFTAGQKQRMDATLNGIRNDIWQAWNIDSTGCDSGYVGGNCNVIADFVTLNPSICIGNSIIFYNKSQNNPSSYQWYFQGGNPATSAVANPTVNYSSIGNFDVKLVTTNAYGTDSMTMTSYIQVTTPPVGQALPYSESFESSSFPANGMTLENADGGVTWERDTIAVAYQGNASAKINNLINTNYGQSDAMILPRFDFTSYAGTPYLSFKWAYAKSDPNYSDEMMVLISKDCGVTWTQVFYRTGTSLVTGPTQTTPYVPDSATVWKAASISLGTYSVNTNVMLKIVNVTDGGNNLYIDNINLGAMPIGIEENASNIGAFSLYPNPSNGMFRLKYSLLNQDNVKLVITDVLGRLVYTREFRTQAAGEHTQEIHAELETGIYNVEVLTTNGQQNTKLIISK